MRHFDVWLCQAFASVKNQIQIERSRGSGPRTLPPTFPLDGQERLEQGPRCERGLPHDSPVQETGLFTHAHGLGIVPCRLPQLGEDAGEAADGVGEMGIAIAQVAAQGDRYRSRSYSTQRAPRTTPG